LVIREENGKKVFTHLNLEDIAIFNSPWYNLHGEDIVYVEQDETKVVDENKIARRQRIIPSIIAGFSLFFLIFDRIIR
jgi:polysaccharide export outer membrane protein